MILTNIADNIFATRVQMISTNKPDFRFALKVQMLLKNVAADNMRPLQTKYKTYL